MFNNFIGGGQVFLHKVRMFWQVFTRTIHIAFLLGVLLASYINKRELMELDWPGFFSYRKAVFADSFDGIINEVRAGIGNTPNHITFVDAKTGSGILATNADPRKIIRSSIFRTANSNGMSLIFKVLIWGVVITKLVFILIFFLWSKFGKDLKAEKTKEGANKVLTAKEVARILRKDNIASDLKIGDMPLVKDMETMNFLVSGSIGSGKTNLMHNLLPQVNLRGEPVVIIDNTGEMIAKYYDPDRGDIIFNPFDGRSRNWDFWYDLHKSKDLEKFAEILIGFNSRKNNRAASDFWEQSAQSIFVAVTEVLQKQKRFSVNDLYATLTKSDAKEMYYLLQGTDAAKYFTKDNAKTAASIVSVLMANIKSLKFLTDGNESNSFTIEHYLNSINEGGKNWLFLSTDPSARELTLPLNAALLEILISRMRRTRTTPENRIWIVIDELPSLGKLPGLSQLMQEGRKYGSCVLAGIQSTSQLYHHYGDADASSLIGLFKTKFAFSSDDPRMGDLYSKLCGTKITISQQKNTSFGANEFRDGISYNEKQDKLPLVSYEEFGKLGVGECYVILPEKSVRVAKIQTPKAEVPSKNAWFMETACEGKSIDEKQVSDDLPLAGETKPTSKQKRLTKDQVEPNNNLSQTESNKNKEPIRDIDISFD